METGSESLAHPETADQSFATAIDALQTNPTVALAAGSRSSVDTGDFPVRTGSPNEILSVLLGLHRGTGGAQHPEKQKCSLHEACFFCRHLGVPHRQLNE
jgi:hypothetical protein